MNIDLTTDYKSILDKIDTIDPIKYGKSRNYINGDVTYLSPYISRGVISTKQVLQSVISKRYKLKEIDSFVKELSWRDYFQRVAKYKNLNTEIKNPQQKVSNYQIPLAVLNHQTNIQGIDNAISGLYKTGYMHNHCRMYTASVVCNVAQSHWLLPSKWFYYHLLDADLASNACSWQWVAGANSNKKYYANQENINKYTLTNQKGTFLDCDYSYFEIMDIPDILKKTSEPTLTTPYPNSDEIEINHKLPTLIYNYYNLDPTWYEDIEANRILLIEPEVFNKYPISEKSMKFMIDLSKNINDIKIYVGSFNSLIENYNLKNVVFKEHYLNNYFGIEEDRDWIVKEIDGYYPSFFAYWNKIVKYI